MTTATPTDARAVARAWHDRASELAVWAWDRMVVRTDVWGGYRPIADREKTCKRPDGSEYVLGATCTHPRKRLRGEVELTPAVLENHFRGRRPEHIAGLHTTSPDNVCRFGTVELDVHGEGGNDPAITVVAAVGWYDELRGRGFRPLLWDSNGAGGFHLDVFFADPVPSANLFWYLRELAAGHARFGLAAPPETFPKQPRVAPPRQKGECGNWCRVVGRHHTRNHLATVYDGAGGCPVRLGEVVPDGRDSGRGRWPLRWASPSPPGVAPSSPNVPLSGPAASGRCANPRAYRAAGSAAAVGSAG